MTRPGKSVRAHRVRLPRTGMTPAAVMAALRQSRRGDARWAAGRTWSLVYYADDAHADRLAEVYRLFFAENALSPPAFPSLARMSAEIVAICAGLLGGHTRTAGSITSGGTESILLGVKTHRDWFRAAHPRVRVPEMVVPASAHPAFHKAADYFGVKAVTVPLGADYRVDVEAMARAITPRTALLVGSAPAWPYGMVDPIPALGRLAKRHGIGLHVDACVGGMFLPFLAGSGHAVPRYDFSVPGVTSISTDLHKFGFAPKGASVVLYRSAALHRFQTFEKPDWLGGAYASPGMLGTRSGGTIAGAWAALMLLGEQGYRTYVGETMALRDVLVHGIRAAGFRVIGEPDMAVVAFTTPGRDVGAVAEWLEERGWWIDRQANPPAIHLVVTPNHARSVGAFVRDLKAAAAATAGAPARRTRTLALYGVTSRPS